MSPNKPKQALRWQLNAIRTTKNESSKHSHFNCEACWDAHDKNSRFLSDCLAIWDLKIFKSESDIRVDNVLPS